MECNDVTGSVAEYLLGGYTDETLSSRMGKRVIQKNCKIYKAICWLLDKVDKDYCYKSIEQDEGEGTVFFDENFITGKSNVFTSIY